MSYIYSFWTVCGAHLLGLMMWKYKYGHWPCYCINRIVVLISQWRKKNKRYTNKRAHRSGYCRRRRRKISSFVYLIKFGLIFTILLQMSTFWTEVTRLSQERMRHILLPFNELKYSMWMRWMLFGFSTPISTVLSHSKHV